MLLYESSDTDNIKMTEHVAAASTRISQPYSALTGCNSFPKTLSEDYIFLSDASFDKQICIQHPTYDDSDNILLILPAQDHADGGLHYGLVIIACHIISNNQEGSLTASRTGASIQADVDDVLCTGDYYYHVPPLCTSKALQLERKELTYIRSSNGRIDREH
jgi:hypothetical protein